MIEALRKQYLASFEDKISRMEQALAGNDRPVLTQLIHQLAGSSGSYGFADMASLCADIEEQLLNRKDNSPASREALVRPLLDEMRRLSTEQPTQP
jgi:HPt (histidine-containing phosphotransfer) domain-containing protein